MKMWKMWNSVDDKKDTFFTVGELKQETEPHLFGPQLGKCTFLPTLYMSLNDHKNVIKYWLGSYWHILASKWICKYGIYK